MARACLALRTGPETCWLLAIIAMTEDAKRYSGPVSFFNADLAAQIGVSISSLGRWRSRAVESGWLHYEPSVRRRAGVYWVMIPPEEQSKPDGPSCEDDRGFPNEFDEQSGRNPRNNPGGIRGTIREESDDPSYLALPQEPLPCPGEDGAEPAPPSSAPPVPTETPVMTFPCKGPGPREWCLVPSKLAEYRESFPAVDVLTECRKARQWTIDNPAKRKTFTGMPAFLTRWLSKEQDRAGRFVNGRSRTDLGQQIRDNGDEFVRLTSRASNDQH
jgi:hypothetical protein